MRRFLSICSAVITLNWFGCGGAMASVSILDSQTSDLVDQANFSSSLIHSYHFFADEPSPLRTYCKAQKAYNNLEVSYDAAVARGDKLAAAVIGGALGRLGEELGHDEWLASDYFDGYESCFCLAFDDIVGPHSAFVDVQIGMTDYRPGVEDFTGNKRGGIVGIGAGWAFPATQQGAYGYVRLGVYDTTGSSTALFSSNSGYSAKTEWMTTGDAGLGIPIFDHIGARSSVGLAVASVRVTGPGGGSDEKLTWGPTIDAGLDYKINRRLKLTLDGRYTYLRDTNFNPVLGVNFRMSESIFIALAGIRYTFGNTAGDKTW